jgi:hypothetical protein
MKKRIQPLKQISYEKFAMMNLELGEEASDEESALAICRTFYPDDTRPWTECVAEFNSLLQKEHTEPVMLDLNFENKEARYFIRADTYVMIADLVGLHNHLTNKNEKNISISLAARVKNEFLKSVDHFKEKYEWIYNPPILPGINKHTIGRDLRNEFQQEYGAYAEITYLLACGDALKFEQVNSMPLGEYLALGEYLIRKRAVEGVE